MTCPRVDVEDPDIIECPATTYQLPLGIPGIGAIFELVGGAILLYQLTQQYSLWEKDLENLQELAECYEEIGTCYKEARLALRGRDQEVYDFQKSRPSYPGPCIERIHQGRLNSLVKIRDKHAEALKSLPSWACGEKTEIDCEAAKAEVKAAMHEIAGSQNYESTVEDQYEQMRISSIARSAGGAIPYGISNAFATASQIAQDDLRRSTGALNDSFSSFGNVVGSLYNKYLTPKPTQIQNPLGEKVQAAPAQQPATNNQSSNVNITLRNEQLLADLRGGVGFSPITGPFDPNPF